MTQQQLIAIWKNRKQPQLSILSCKLCNHTSNIGNFKVHTATDMFYAEQLIRYQCPECDVIFGDLRFLALPLSEIAQDYAVLYSYYKESDTSLYITHVIDKINLGKNKKYLDYACGASIATIELLNSKGYNVYGYDAYVRLEHPKFLNKVDTSQRFDVIYSNNFIEHVINPYEDIKNLLDLLADGGKLVMISPCWEYCYEYSHYHTFFFVNRSVKYLCDLLHINEIYSDKIEFSDNITTIVKIFEKRAKL